MSFSVTVLSKWFILVQYLTSKCETIPESAFEMKLKPQLLWEKAKKAKIMCHLVQIQKEVENKQISAPEKLF